MSSPVDPQNSCGFCKGALFYPEADSPESGYAWPNAFSIGIHARCLARVTPLEDKITALIARIATGDQRSENYLHKKAIGVVQSTTEKQGFPSLAVFLDKRGDAALQELFDNLGLGAISVAIPADTLGTTFTELGLMLSTHSTGEFASSDGSGEKTAQTLRT